MFDEDRYESPRVIFGAEGGTLKAPTTHPAFAHRSQMHCVRFLVETHGAEVNQQDRARGWTPLHHAAAQAHVTSRPYMQLFEYLLQSGADPALLTDAGWDHPVHGRVRIRPPRQTNTQWSYCTTPRSNGIIGGNGRPNRLDVYERRQRSAHRRA